MVYLGVSAVLVATTMAVAPAFSLPLQAVPTAPGSLVQRSSAPEMPPRAVPTPAENNAISRRQYETPRNLVSRDDGTRRRRVGHEEWLTVPEARDVERLLSALAVRDARNNYERGTEETGFWGHLGLAAGVLSNHVSEAFETKEQEKKEMEEAKAMP